MNTARKLAKLTKWLPLSKTIVFESNPDFACNTYPVYKELLNHLPNYRFIWLTHKRINNDNKRTQVIYTGKNASVFEKIKTVWTLDRCKCMVSSNLFERKRHEKQVFLFLCHGSKTKKTRGLYEMGDAVDYIDVQSHFFDDIITYEYDCKKEQLVYLGYPRCDYLFSSSKPDVRGLINCETNEKYVIWLPTFRSQAGGQVDVEKGGIYDKLGMPIIYSIEKLRELNDYLKDINLHILFKPHPSQDVSTIKSEKLSNIHVIYDSDITGVGLQLYEVIAGSEALITDYSSVFFDYLLLDHPIATTTDDIDSWKSGRGFAFDIEKMYDQATVRVANQAELVSFLNDVITKTDSKCKGRREIRDMTNIYNDGDSAKRVADFVIKHMGER